MKNGDKLKLKSRLAAKRFEEDCLEEIPKYSPTIDKSSLRAVLSVITQHNWSVNAIDIKTVGKEATNSFKYIELNLSQEEMCIMLTQKDYINNRS